MKVCIILGTRPEIIKMSPIIRQCIKLNLDYFILHTGQHYSYELDQSFFKDLNLPEPRYNLNIGSGSHAVQTAGLLVGIEEVLIKEKPDIVLVQGDTNTVLSGALAASKLHIKIGHVEAGLRSYDRTMPEEINRIITDHISDYLYAPTDDAKNNLIKEGISPDKIFVTGNTVVDSVVQNLQISKDKENVLSQYNLTSGNYILTTFHRAENVDNREKLANILSALQAIHTQHGLPIIFPMHPRTEKMINLFGISTEGIRVLKPLGYFTFLQLEENAKAILTDSGGLQEEGCILGTPCLTLRENTERPETVSVGANILVGTNKENILHAYSTLKNNTTWINPYGDGKSAEKILDTLSQQFI